MPRLSMQKIRICCRINIMKKLIVGLSGLFLLTFLSCSNSGSVADGDTAGEILYLEGSVTVNGREAEIGSAVMDGDELVTDPDSYLEVQFGDSRVFKAEENSRLVLDAGEKTIKLGSGALAVVQSKARWLSRKKPWLVETPTMVAAVRGTIYYTKVESPDEVYFCICNGKIHLADSENSGELDMEAAHHKAVRYIRSADGIVRQDAPMIYHSDEGMEHVAREAGVSIDWSEIPDS